MNKFIPLILGAAVGLLFPISVATSAFALALVPISQDFAPSGRLASQTFRLENESDRQVAVTVKVMSRDMSIDGSETNAETKDFLVFPSQAVIGPRQTQVIRVQYRGTPAPIKEAAYRIIAEQQPIRSELGPNTRAIQLVVRYVGSIYILPTGARADVTLESARAVTEPGSRRMLELVFNNNGRAHTLIDEPELTLSAGGVTKTFAGEELDAILGENILAGSKRRFVMPWPADLPFGDPQAQFKFQPLR